MSNLAVDHAELIRSLKAASAYLSNAAYCLEHPEIHEDEAKTLGISASLIWAGTQLVDDLRAKGKALDELPKVAGVDESGVPA